MRALLLGLDVDARGYNLFVSGVPGSGREGTVRTLLERTALERPTPDDWAYVENFADSDSAMALRMPAGRGVELATEVDDFIAAVSRAIRAALETDNYAQRRRALAAEAAGQRDALLERVREFAHERGFAAETAMTGIVTIPLVQGRPIEADEFRRLPEGVRRQIEQRGEEIQEQVAEAVVELRQIDKELGRRVHALDRDVADFAIAPMVQELAEKFADLPVVLAHIRAVREELLDHVDDFREAEGSDLPPPLAALAAQRGTTALDRYRVNLIVDHSKARGAAVVVERSPTYYNLTGRIDYRSTFGSMVTDFRHIKAGALHRANGGFLVLHASEVLRTPFAWEALKSALTNRAIRIENLATQYSGVPTVTLRPEPIPLDVKVVLIGTPLLYTVLSQYDEDFRELFKVRVDFAPEMAWDDDTPQAYARLVSRLVRDAGLRHFRRSAVARVVEHAARMRQDQRKLSTRMSDIQDVVVEASYWASKAGRRLVSAEDVTRAIDQREYRSNMVEERVREMIARETLRVETTGGQVGQVCGVAVIDVGDHAFGLPCRITARTSMGGGGVKSIERETELSGPLHSKGMLILAGYLAATYAQDLPLAVAATLTFEQSYDEVEGDSASCAELCALLSELSGLPIDQGIAVTGSVDQRGLVQAVGGVTTKVEGFFRVCAERGLTGGQGMVIPSSNVEHLMLHEDVIAAARAGRFKVWPVATVDEAISLLTGREAGARRRDGTFGPSTVHRLVDDRLRAYAEGMREFAAHARIAEGRGE